jgi:hypothetical protein
MAGCCTPRSIHILQVCALWLSLLKGEDIVRFIKSQRIRWLEHVERMEDNAMTKRMLKGRLYSKRRKGRPKMRWPEDVESDLKRWR